MYIVMNVLGLPFNGETLETTSLGGSESAGYYVARELAKRGHKVTIFTSSKDEGVFEDVRYVWAGNCTQKEPLGERFHFYALRTQHDVCIIQRHPGAFAYRWASKINLLWLHDLALHRNAGTINNCLWNIDGVLPVSAWHGKQLQEVYGLSPEIIYPVKNGVDLAMYAESMALVNKKENAFSSAQMEQFKLLYAARPERGLENLVKPDGIMARLAKISPDYHLYFCGYDNVTPEMRAYYEQLWRWADELPNCTNLGALTKQELADVERQCDLYVYPTAFEDTSCIMAMECAAAGLPFLASEVGALSETCKDTGSILLDPKDDNSVDIPAFVSHIKLLATGSEAVREDYKKDQLAIASSFSWERAADTFEDAISKCFAKTKANDLAVLKHFEHVSDIYALWKYAGAVSVLSDEVKEYLQHIESVYAFAREGAFKQHYEEYYAKHKHEFGSEDLTGNHRFESVARLVGDLAPGSVVLDYGCAHGHYTVNLAKRFPQLKFIGVDLAESNIDTARRWADSDGIRNAYFHVGDIAEGEIRAPSGLALWADQPELKFDCILACEVLEHVAAPAGTVDALCACLNPAGRLVATTPYGPWEAANFEKEYPYRFHLWHFERGDLRDLFGMHPKFNVVSAFHGLTPQGEVLGSYITTFQKPTQPSGQIDYDRKFAAIASRQTVSLCMIVKDAESTIRKTLETVTEYIDEAIIGIDETTTDNTRQIIEKYLEPFVTRGRLSLKLFGIPSPLISGFDDARNKVIAEATCQWIFWPDADETLVHGNELPKYLRNNQYGGYATSLRHFTMEPAGLLRTDLPTKLFRNGIDAKFFGMVHEHPETALNKGLGYVTVANDFEIAHFSYITEAIRRGRFSRNLNLMRKDRQKNPDRTLGKWLWVRDLAQMCRWELERNGGILTPQMEGQAREGLLLWQDIVKDGNVRLIMDGLQFYSELNAILGEGFDYGCLMDTSKANGGLHMDKRQPIIGRFSNVKEAQQVTELLLRERTRVYDSKYF